MYRFASFLICRFTSILTTPAVYCEQNSLNYSNFRLKYDKYSFASTSGLNITYASGLDHFDGNLRIVHSHGVDASSPHSPYIDQVTSGGTRCP